MACSSSNSQAVKAFFRIHGYQIKSEGVSYLEQMLQSVDRDERTYWLQRIVSCVQKLPLKDSVLDEHILQTAVNECSQAENEESQIFNVIDAFSVPKFVYDPEKKKFIPHNEYYQDVNLQLHGTAVSKADLYRARYTSVYQRTLRHPLFVSSALDSGDGGAMKLKRVEDLFGAPGRTNEAVVLGMLTQMKADKFYLEDPTGSVELDLSKTVFHTGLFTEDSIVLAEGWYEDAVFHVKAIGFPPVETSKEMRTQFGNLNFFGGESKTSVKVSEKLRRLEAEREDATVVLVSDLWLDVPQVIEKFRMLLEGFAESVPVCFVICGMFLSKSYGPKQCSVMRDGFKTLSDVMLSFPELVETTNFVFVPSVTDPGLANILPRPGLPNVVVSPVLSRVPNCHFASNPCRLQFGTQEIVVFREDVIEKMSRNCIQMPNEHKDIPLHFVKTIASAGHLCPLAIHVAPVYWDYDHSLGLYPLPDLAVVADKYDPFTLAEKECLFTNPGSFSRNNFSFQVYIPSSRTVEDSQID